jgi:hypothetical protein
VNKNDNTVENRIFFQKDPFSVKMGAFISADNAGITLGSKQAGLGIIFDLEDALGLNTSSFVFRGTSDIKFGKRNHSGLVVDYFGINRKATKVLEADLELGGNTYPIGSTLVSKFYLSIIAAKYEYTFLQDERVSLGLSAGLYIIPLSFSVKSGTYEDQNTALVVPLPVFGMRSDFLITKKLSLHESVQMLYMQFDNFTGSILDLNIAIEHRTFNHFGFGAGLNSNRLDLAAKGKDYPAFDFFGTIKMNYTGAYIFATFYL